MSPSPKQTTQSALLLFLLLAVLGLLAGGYYALRYAGWTMEVDASRQAVSADGILVTGRLENARSYNNGFGYSAQLALVSLLSGLDLRAVQLGSGMWIFVVALVGFITYRELLGGVFGGALATLVLLLQPDFLFYVVRGSHERTTWVFALLMLFFLVRSYRNLHSPGWLLVNVLLFYFSFWAMANGNVYFASTYLLAITLGLAVSWLYERLVLKGKSAGQLGANWWSRFVLISLTCFIIVFMFINYAYGPAILIFYLFNSLTDQLSLLFLGTDPIASPSAYQVFGSAWRHPAAYLAVTGTQWALSLASLGAWLWATLRLGRLEPRKRLVWQMYTSFGAILAFGILADYAGFMNSNMQLRMFTPFALFSSAMVAYGIQEGLHRLSPLVRRRLAPAAALLAVLAFVAVQAKITNDPLIANQWLFYSPAEIKAQAWIDRNMRNQQVWIDSWDHLREVFYFWEGYNEARPNEYVYGTGRSGYAYVLMSELTQLRANRIFAVLPPVADYLRIYDNGVSQLYKRRPATPYQR